MGARRGRRRLVLLAVVAGGVALVASYRSRQLARSTAEFHERYDSRAG